MALIGPFADGKFIQSDEQPLMELLKQSRSDRQWADDVLTSAYKFVPRADGQYGCCRCGTAISRTYDTGTGLMGPPVYATEEGWLSLCAECYTILNKEEHL